MDDERKQRRLRLLKAMRDSLELFGARALRIKTKDMSIEPFVMNEPQKYVHERLEEQLERTGKVRALVLKGRQQGISTYVAARFYQKSSLRKGRNVFIMAHAQDSSDALFKIVDRYHTNNPFAPHTAVSNVKELEFDRLDSSYAVGTAGQKAGGRGKTPTLYHGCLSPETWIIEPNGSARRMKDFAVGDEVRTHTGAVAPISFISRQKKPVFAVKVLGAGEPILATAEHRFLTPEGKRRLSELRPGDVLLHHVSVLGDETLAWPYRLDYGCRSRAGGTGSGGVAAVGPDKLEGTFELGRVLGLYLAEGCVFRQSDGTPSGVTFSIHEREVKRTLAWLRPFHTCWRSEPKATPRVDSKTVTVTVHSRSFAEFCEARCGSLDSKQLPDEWRRSRQLAHGLVVGYFAGDGGGCFKNGRRISAPSIRSAITFGMRDALAALGYGWATVKRREGAVRNGRNERTQWAVRLSGPGVDRLWAEMGREAQPRKRHADKPKMPVKNGFAHVAITSIEPVGVQDVMDFEVDHPDHSYATWQCASSNSEVAFWSNASEHFAASVQGVPGSRGTEVILESTANGPAGEFYERWQDAVAGRSDYIAIFVPWFWSSEYRRDDLVDEDFELEDTADEGELSEVEYAEMFGLDNAQMAWRRMKIAELRSLSLFKQEYPATAEEAFQTSQMDSFIAAAHVLRARKRKNSPAGPLILGVDPAGPGGDRFAVYARRGYGYEFLKWRDKVEAPEANLWLKSLIDKHDPAVVFIDAGGIGAATISLLRAEGPRYSQIVKAVNFGSTSQHKLAKPKVPGPKNRRAEMWERARDYLLDDVGVSIPDLDALQADLTGPTVKPSTTNDLLLESKTDMKKRGIRSPDLADSFVLTFADLRHIDNYSEAPKRGQDPVFDPDAAGVSSVYGDFDNSEGWMA